MKMKRIPTFSILISAILFLLLNLIGCNNDRVRSEGDEHIEGTDDHSETVQLSQQELNEFGIELAKAGPGKLDIQVSLPGEIIIPPDNLAHIHPRFPGMVKEVFKHIGDPVKKGQTLAIIEGNESLTEYEIKSLIDGTIVEKHLSLGEIVTDSDHGFVIADLSEVWAMLKLYQKDLPFVEEGQKVKISSGSDMPQSTGKIAYVSPIIDEITRTAEARIILPNPEGRWRPGLFITGQIVTSDLNVDILIPQSALEYYEDQQVVFIQTDEGFEPRAVIVGRMNDAMAEITTGLAAGETYISKGGFTIKTELQKSEFGEGHGH
jgi:cobalt-zinc-cadmium efflux system membrane fusion protein